MGLWLDALPVRLYAVHDFWHTSPNFFMVRVGVVLVILLLSYLWCRWGAGEWGFSPLIELGKCSLLVYWVHIEFVYGGLSILPKRSEGIGTATLGLAIIFVAMTLLAVARNRFPGHKAEIMSFFRRGARRSFAHEIGFAKRGKFDLWAGALALTKSWPRKQGISPWPLRA